MKTFKTRSTIRLHLSALALAFAIGAPVVHADASLVSGAGPEMKTVATVHATDAKAPAMSPKAARRLAKASRELTEGMAGFQAMLFSRGSLSDDGDAVAMSQQWQKGVMP